MRELPWHRILRVLPPETAHRTALRLARFAPPAKVPLDARLRTQVAGLDLLHPVGLAAGFDKNAVALNGLAHLGFAMLEVGTVTPRPQGGNPRPRLFRLIEDEALINRMGFNNDGLARVLHRLASRRPVGLPVGANIGMNKGAAVPVDDYLAGLEGLGPVVDYITVNVSSPNTPGLRALQKERELRSLIEPLVTCRNALQAALDHCLPLFVKIAPDLTPEDEAAIAEVALGTGIDGLIISNTTVSRPAHLRSRWQGETGGLSGRPLLPGSTALLCRMRRRVGDRLALIAVGGIMSDEDAWTKICAGADALQLYTGLIYCGPDLVRQIVEGLLRRLDRHGMRGLRDAVGRDA